MENLTPAPELWGGISLEGQKMALPILARLPCNLAKDDPVIASAANGHVAQKTIRMKQVILSCWLLMTWAFLGIARAQTQPEMPVPSNAAPVAGDAPSSAPIPSNAPTNGKLAPGAGAAAPLTPPDAGAPTPNLAASNAVTGEIIPPADRVKFTPIPYDGPDVPSPEAVRAYLADARLRAGENGPLLPLESVIVGVLNNNPQRAAARDALQAAIARVGNAKSAGGLQVDLSAIAAPGRPRTTAVGGAAGTGIGTGGTNFPGYGVSSAQQLSVDAVYSLYNGGRVKAGTMAARAGARAQAALALQTEQNLVTGAATAYLEVLRRAQLLEVADNNLAVSRERRRVAIRRFQGGAAPRLDVLSADANFADARQRRVQAVSDVAQARASLNILRGVAPETPFRTVAATDFALGQSPNVPIFGAPVGQLLNATPAPGVAPGSTTFGVGTATDSTTALSIPENTGETLRALAEQSRPALAQSRAQIEAADQQINAARAQKRPAIDLNFGAILRSPTRFVGSFALTLAGTLAQNLFDNGRAKSQIAEARALAAQSRDDLRDQRLQVADQIERALLAFDVAQIELDTTGVAVVAAQGALRATQTGYAAGTKTQVDISDAQSVLLQAQTDAVNARFNVATARVNISAATGVLLPEAQTAFNSVIARELAEKKVGK